MSSLSIHAGQEKLSRETYSYNQEDNKLSDEEFSKLYKSLSVKGGLMKLRGKERYINDPPFNNQNFCLLSFVPSKGARPDSKGVYGWAKCRGTFATEVEMNKRAEHIIREIDSFHHLFHARVGVPFPFTLDPSYVEEEIEINIQEKAKRDANEDIKRLRAQDKKEIKEVIEAEERLLDDVDEEKEEDPLDNYIQSRVKRATLVCELLETRKKMDKMIKSLKKTDKEVTDQDEKDSGLNSIFSSGTHTIPRRTTASVRRL